MVKPAQWVAFPLIMGIATVSAACSSGTESLPEESQPNEVPTEPIEDFGTDPMQEPLEMPGEEDTDIESIPDPSTDSDGTPSAPDTP